MPWFTVAFREVKPLVFILRVFPHLIMKTVYVHYNDFGHHRRTPEHVTCRHREHWFTAFRVLDRPEHGGHCSRPEGQLKHIHKVLYALFATFLKQSGAFQVGSCNSAPVFPAAATCPPAQTPQPLSESLLVDIQAATALLEMPPPAAWQQAGGRAAPFEQLAVWCVAPEISSGPECRTEKGVLPHFAVTQRNFSDALTFSSFASISGLFPHDGIIVLADAGFFCLGFCRPGVGLDISPLSLVLLH